MKLNFRLPFWSSLLLIPVLILSACAPAAPVDLADEIVTSHPASPTPAAFPVALQPTQSSPAQTPLQARLAVIKSLAKLLRNGGGQSAVQQAQSADLRVHDRVEMVKLEGQIQQSYAILYFPDFVNVELFANTKMSLAGVKQDAEGSADVTLNLEAGHMFVHLNDERNIHVSVRTPNAIINALTSGAEFDVCHNEKLTCVMVKRGVVEIVAQGKREVVRAGSAGLVLNERPLSPTICAPAAKFIAWEEEYRLFANAPALEEEIAALPQEPCSVSANGFPWNARILYRDEFTNPRGWAQGEIGNFAVRYIRHPGARYYQVEVQGAGDPYLSFVPNKRNYEDVNIDIKTRTEAASPGDFRYGVVFRRSGEQYYAFVVSPPDEAWYFLKSSSEGMEILKSGIEKQIRGLDGQDTLRVETYGSTFILFINNRFIDWISDSEYARGEVGLFVDSRENPDAVINFNSITIWQLPAPALGPAQGEICFNAGDDDGDGWIDQADPNCQREPLIAASSLTPTPPLSTSTPRATRTPRFTRTPRPPTATQPPLPTLPPILPTLPPILPTVVLPTIQLPTIDLPLPLGPLIGTPTPR